MSSSPGNIFLTTENLAFSLPLILVCGSYAYFKYIPLHIGLPVLAGIFVLYEISARVKTQRDKKLTNMDEKAINDLALQLEGEDKAADDSSKEAEAKKIAKKKAAIQHRLAVEAKKASKKKGKKGKTDDDDDDVALDAFAKGTKKKN